mgnify:CR=1 FL=1
MKKLVLSTLVVAVLGLGVASGAEKVKQVAAKDSNYVVIDMQNTPEESYWDFACEKLAAERHTNKIIVKDRVHNIIIICEKRK